MKQIQFLKYQAAGNDFVLIDDLDELVQLDEAQIRRLCDRHFGVGADGLMLVRPSDEADAKMIFFNPDGTPAEMCGNGIRAFAKYLYDRGLVTDSFLRIETPGGIRALEVTVSDGSVSSVQVDMGVPGFATADVPVKLPTVEAVNVPIDLDGEIVTATCVSMGNPHCVTFVDDVETAPVDRLGPILENHSLFPNRTNVEFAQIAGPGTILVRVWERGAGETLACGTGACAAAVAAARTGRAQRRVQVHLPGGVLDVRWEENGRVLMSGPATEVFSGTIDIESLSP